VVLLALCLFVCHSLLSFCDLNHVYHHVDHN
jgi:hypothetical protein